MRREELTKYNMNDIRQERPKKGPILRSGRKLGNLGNVGNVGNFFPRFFPEFPILAVGQNRKLGKKKTLAQNRKLRIIFPRFPTFRTFRFATFLFSFLLKRDSNSSVFLRIYEIF